VNSNLPLARIRTLREIYGRSMERTSFTLVMLAIAAGVALFLGVVGIYGVISYSTAQRTREIGVRMALGADAGRVRLMVLRQVGGMMVVGGIVGLLGALGLGKAASSLLYQLKGSDPVVFALSLVALTLVAFGAGYVPARRASEVDPIKALRYE